jgi:anti-sigma B factor antagonist
MSLTIDLEQEPNHWVLRLAGDLDYGECAAFRMSIDRILKKSPPATIVDLSELEYLDSSGLGLLLSLSKEYGAQGGRLVLVTNETVDNILSLTRLNGIFSTASSMEDAVATVSEKPLEVSGNAEGAALRGAAPFVSAQLLQTRIATAW